MTAVAAAITGARRLRPAAPFALGLLLAGGAAVAWAALGAGVAPARVAMLLLVAPLLEELVLRAGVHEALLRGAVDALAANLIAALVFGVVHVLLRGDPNAFGVALPALAIGWLYQHTRRLAPCVALHAAMNAAWLGWNLL